MTSQIPDVVVLEGVEHELVAVDGTGLFQPYDHGLRPVGTSTANHRGYQARYAVRDARLLLDSVVDVGLEAARQGAPLDELPRIAGIAPTEDGWGLSYLGLDLPVEFTGGLLVAEGFLPEHYVHMGFHPAWKYERVHELIVEDGQVLRQVDRSEQMAEIREDIVTGERADPDATGDVVTWIRRTFERDYGRSLGT